jgi:hypothetical protein
MTKYPDAIFRNVDIFEHRELLSELGVKATPTFKLWVNGEFSTTLEGASGFEDLDKTVGTLVTEYTTELANAEQVLAQTKTRGGIEQKLAALF